MTHLRQVKWVKTRKALSTPDRNQLRLTLEEIYSDDPVFAAVGVARSVRLLTEWRRLTLELNLLTGIPAKRIGGCILPWTGVLLAGTLGVLLAPQPKLARASLFLHKVADGETLTFEVQESSRGSRGSRNKTSRGRESILALTTNVRAFCPSQRL